METVFVSPKYSALAIDEFKDQEFEENFEPNLQVINGCQTKSNSLLSVTDHVVQIKGRITVSF